MRKIVLVSGLGRSGTNLTRRIIGSHSKIAIPPAEFKFFSEHARGKSVRDILSNERLEQWNVDFSDLYSCEPRDVYVKSLTRYAESIGKEILGEKTPLNEFYYDTIQDWLQDFEIKFVHMVRNPFDVVASQKHMFGKTNRKIDVSVYCRNWQRSVSMGLARANNNPKGYYLLRFEDLTADAVTVTRDLCDFLEVDFEQDRMLTLSDFSGHRDNTSFVDVNSKADKKYTAIRQPQSRKHFLTDPEKRAVGSICGELALALGYQDDDFKSFPPDSERPSRGGKLRRFVKSRMS